MKELIKVFTPLDTPLTIISKKFPVEDAVFELIILVEVELPFTIEVIKLFVENSELDMVIEEVGIVTEALVKSTFPVNTELPAKFEFVAFKL